MATICEGGSYPYRHAQRSGRSVAPAPMNNRTALGSSGIPVLGELHQVPPAAVVAPIRIRATQQGFCAAYLFSTGFEATHWGKKWQGRLPTCVCWLALAAAAQEIPSAIGPAAGWATRAG